ncbi:MAG: hypothetical protein LAN62_02115 [Acidobacteriia bacterium]|nr:hypothetical protein [Terriglobia bacterium]
MRLELQNLSDELNEIKGERLRKAEEARAERDANLQQEREERNRLRQEEAEAASAQRRREWFTAQAKTAIDLLYRKAARIPVDLTGCQEEIAARLAQTLAQELSKLGPDSPAREVETATRRVVEVTLRPYRKAKEQKDVIESALGYIPLYLSELQRRGWLDCASGDVEFLAAEVSGAMRHILERESQRRELSRSEAEELVRNGIDERFQIV